MSNTTTRPFVDAAKAHRIYQEQIRPTLTEADKGKFITINVETGEYEIDDDDLAGARRARTRFGSEAPLLMVRVGYKAAVKLGGAWANVEESNW